MEQAKVMGETGEHRLISVERRFKLVPRLGGLAHTLPQGSSLQEAIKEARAHEMEEDLWIEETITVRSKLEIPPVTRKRTER